MQLRTRRPNWRRALRALTVTTSTLATVVAGTLTASALAGPVTGAAPISTPVPAADTTADTTADPRSSFTLAVLPDTQFYSRYSASQFYPKYGTNPFETQTQWIVDHQDELNIPFTVHVGDVVDQEWVTSEFDAGKKAMDILTSGGMPYSVLPGNHDVQSSGSASSAAAATNYLRYFGDATLTAQADATGAQLLGTYQQGLSSAYLFEAEGHTWMSLALAWNASDDTLTWAQTVMDAHPDVPVILSSHAIVNIDTDQVSPAYWAWGEQLWERLIRKNDQIVMTASGHFHGNTMQTRTNDFGHPVYQVLSDFQMAADGGNGYMNLFEFDLTHGQVNVSTVSPWVTQKDPELLTSTDAPVLTGGWRDFSVDIDFAGRFGWTVDPAEEDEGDLTAKAKEIVSEGWDGGAGQEEELPAGSSEDYVEVSGTVAHWRFGEVADGALAADTEVPDVAGQSPMRRNPIEATDADDELDDVRIDHADVPYYSADQGAVCFDEVTRTDGDYDQLGFLTTEYGAPATFADLEADAGYTIETFLKLDEDWTETSHRWSAALTRGGARQWTGIADSTDPLAGASWLGISNLREYQFTAGDSDSGASYTLWSGEIMQNAWHHVAVVSDPDAGTVIMYVDGVAVLRNAADVGGMMASDYVPWIIGASTYSSEPDHGWFGCVGETRVVDHALDTTEFLYHRVDIDGDGDNFALSTDLTQPLAHDATVAVLNGRGHPGATVRVEVGGEERGSATVAASGAWSVDLADPISGAGVYEVDVVQSIGSRAGSPYQTSVVIQDEPAPGELTTAVPTISGDAVVGTTVSAVPGTWTEGTSFGYQWLSDGVAVAGATDATFAIPATLAGTQLAVAVTGSKDGYLSVTESSIPVTVAAATLSSQVPTISGTALVGTTVSAVPGTWTEGTSFGYQWLSDGVAVAGATDATFAIPATLAGTQLAVAVTGSKDGYLSVTETSVPVTVAAATLTSQVPTISGTARVGETVSAVTGSWTEGAVLDHQWLVNGVPLAGATARDLVLPPSAAGAELTVAVTGSKPGYVPVTRTSSGVSVAAAKLTAAKPRIAGKVKAGATVRARTGSWTPGTVLHYRWLADGAKIKGATGRRFKIPARLVGTKLVVRVTGSMAGYTSVTKTSTAKRVRR